MGTGVLLSIDTELTWRAHAAGASWSENFARSIDAAGVGIGYQLDRLAANGLKACFFIDPMPAAVFGIEPVRRMVAPILAAGQEVQLHLHPMWVRSDRRAPVDDPRHDMRDHDADEQLALIEQARELLRQAGAPDPVAFRAGAFGANRDTLRMVAKAGLRIDSSHNGCEVPHPCDTGLPAALVAPLAVDGVIELPIGLVRDGAARLRHLQIGAVTGAEMRAALRHAEAQGNPLVTIVGHSFELATRAGTRANAIVRRRFDHLCGWLGHHRERFPTRFAAECLDVPLGVAATPAPHAPLRRTARVAVQGLSNLYYERRL